MISRVLDFLLAVSISLLAVAQFRVGGQGLDIPLLFLVVGLVLMSRLFGVGVRRFRADVVLTRDFLYVFWCLILLVVLHVVDILRTDGDLRVVQAVVKVTIGVFIYVFFAVYRFDRDVFMFGLALASSSVIGFYIFNSYFVLGAPYLVNNLEEVTKAGRNQIALYLSSITVLLTYSLVSRKARVAGSLLLSFSVFIHFLALIYCASRSAWVSSFLGLVPLFLVYRLRSILGFTILVAIIFVSISILSAGDSDIVGDMLASLSDRVMSIFSGVDPEGEESISVREELLMSALNDFSSAPVLGIGVEQFLPKHNYVTHNTYMQYLVENGLIGLFFFLAPVFLIARNSFKALRRGLASRALNASFAFYMSSLCFFVNIAFVNILGAPLFFVMLGFAIAQNTESDERVV